MEVVIVDPCYSGEVMEAKIKMNLRRRQGVLLCGLLAFAIGVSFAIQPTPLPDFELSTLDGQTVKSSDLPSQGHWLLIYVQSNHQFSDRLLKLLKREDFPGI